MMANLFCSHSMNNLLLLFLLLNVTKLFSHSGQVEGACTCPASSPEAASPGNVSTVDDRGCTCSEDPAPAPAQGPGLAPAPAPGPARELRPEDFQDIKLFQVYPVIQKFKAIVTSDPQNTTASWVGPDICNAYKGFYCDNPPSNLSAITVAAIDFNGFLLAAPSITDFLVGFPDLAIFHANSNRFAGTIPSGIAGLPFLFELDVSNNLLSGSFPTAVLGVLQISFLDIRYNAFSGAVPGELFTTFPVIDVLFLNNNQFTQALPKTIGNLKASYLTLANNKFTGPIPSGLYNTSNTLIEVLLLNNEFNGCIPYEIGLLKEATVFDVGSNKLTGTIPYSFGCMAKLEQLNLAGNRLYGAVPEVVCTLANLQNLSLSDNYFTSLGPHCWNLTKTGVLDDRNNCIPGRPSQRSHEECAAFALEKVLCHRLLQYYIIPCDLPSHSQSPPPASPSPKKKLPPSSLRTYGALHSYRAPKPPGMNNRLPPPLPE